MNPITTFVGMWGRNINAMFKAIGQVILLFALLHVFGEAFAAFERAAVATFDTITVSATQLR